MRTLQEKYNGINEGKFTKEQFLRDARMEQPNLVTRFNGYDDAVKILKNRGMIKETYSTEESFKDYSDDALTDMIINSSRFEGNEDIIARVKAELARRKESMQEEVDTESEFDVIRGGRVIARNVKFFPNGRDYRVGNKVDTLGPNDSTTKSTMGGATDMVNHIKSQGGLEEARLTNKSLTDYRYKPTNDMDKYPYEQILRGLRVELEGLNVLGTPTPEEYTKALGKVLKNLEKDSIFYTNQVAGVKANAKRTDLMIDATPKNEVDKENGLKKAALKEAIKGVIKNILSENKDPDLYDQDEERDGRRFVYNDQGDFGPESDFGDYYPEPEEEDVYEMYGEDEIDYDDENFSDPLIDGEEEDDIPHPRGYEEASDEETFDDLFKENKSEKELRAEWEKYQATCHPEDRMSYMEWRSEQGLNEAVSLFDILDENYETDPYNLNDKTDYRKMGAEAFYHNKKRSQNPYSLDSPAGIDWDKGWDKAQSAESDSYKGY